MTSVPGNKLFAGMTFGIAEGSSMILSSIVVTKVKNILHVFTFFCMVVLVSQSVFYFVCGGESGSWLALAMIFNTTLGCGSSINIIYLMLG
jgi:hypothetical protein